jgi:hypothetical protein
VRRALVVAGLVAIGVGAQAPAPGAAAPGAAARAAVAAPPKVSQLIVFRDGSSLSKTVSTKATSVKVAGHRCTAGDATALAALARSHPGKLRLHDFGSCSRRAADGGGLFVRGIRGDLNKGQNGWVYKVGRRAASAGAADPGGPFGRGRLRSGQRVTWFYCRMRSGGCQRSLELKVRVESGGKVVATVRGYDDEGKGVAVAGATVTTNGTTAQTDASGAATLSLGPGRHAVVAAKPGLVRSFAERVEVP